MNILHVVHRYYPAIGGAEKYMQELSERFVKDNNNVSVYTTNARDIDYFFDKSRGEAITALSEQNVNGVHVHRFKIAHFPLRKQITAALSLLPSWQAKCLFHPYQMLVPDLYRKSFTPQNIDIVHAASSPFTSLLFMGYKIAKRNNVPFVLTPFLHLGDEYDEDVRREHTCPHQIRLWEKADAIITCTSTERNFIEKMGIPSNRIHSVGVGIEPEELAGGHGDQFKQQHNVSPDEKLIAHIARWDKNKGTVQLLEAFKILLCQNRKIRLVLLGTPTNEFKTYWSTVSESTKKNCIVLEFPDDQTKKNVLDAIDLYVMPSRVESFGIAYIESWFYKKPVIGADIPAVREIISNSQDGFLVKFGDAQQLTEKISIILDNPSLAIQMGEAGYKKTLSSLLWDQKYPMIRSLYNELTHKNPSS